MIEQADLPARGRPHGGEGASSAFGLTPRERDVFELVGLALTNREIACRLLLSEKTVKSHVTAVMRKLGVRNRVEAALIAARQHGPLANTRQPGFLARGETAPTRS